MSCFGRQAHRLSRTWKELRLATRAPASLGRLWQTQDTAISVGTLTSSTTWICSLGTAWCPKRTTTQFTLRATLPAVPKSSRARVLSQQYVQSNSIKGRRTLFQVYFVTFMKMVVLLASPSSSSSASSFPLLLLLLLLLLLFVLAFFDLCCCVLFFFPPSFPAYLRASICGLDTFRSLNWKRYKGMPASDGQSFWRAWRLQHL